MKMDVVKLLEFGEGFVRWAVVEGRNEVRSYVNSPTREAALYEARGAARDWGVLRMRLAGLAFEDALGRPRFLTTPVPWGLGLDAESLEPEEDAAGVAEMDAGSLGTEEDAAGVGEAERDEVGDADSEDETSTLPFLAAPSDSMTSESESSMASAAVDRGRLEGALGGSINFCLGAVGEFLVAVDAFGAVLNGLALALTGSFVDASLSREPGQETKDPGDETGSSTSGPFSLIVTSFSFGSLDDPDEAGLSCKDLRIEEGDAADAVLTGEFPGPMGDDIWWLLGV